MKRDYVGIANRYIDDVLAGREPACKWVKAACKRQRRDLKAAKGKAWAYRFDKAEAERPCAFLELLPHIKGPLARATSQHPRGQPLTLAPWQIFVVTTGYGWLHKAGPLKGKRRFRSIYLEVPRGNGKSAILSGLSLYALCADREEGAEVYSAAVTRDQAKIVFGTARKMAQKLPALRASRGLTVHTNAIAQEKTASTFKPLASDEDSLDGLNVHFAAIDELHAHKTRAVYDVVETGMGKRDQPMLIVITTAGSNRAGICYEVRGYIIKLLQGVAKDETAFGIIYTIDDGDDQWIEETWRKANPNWNISVDPLHVARLAAKAMQMPSAQPNFLTKHLNLWVNANVAWMDMRVWEKCGDPSLRIEDFEGERARVALDLATKTDIAAKMRLFTREIEGIKHYYFFGSYYLPAQAIEDGRNSQYMGWRTAGLLIETEGDVIDFATIEDDVRDDVERFKEVEVAFDPWQTAQMAQRLQAEGVPCVEYRALVANFSAPMKEIEALARQGRLHHDGDLVLAWMVSNVVCHTDAKDNIYPRKERPENKIDGVVAAIMALGREMTSGAEGDSFWNKDAPPAEAAAEKD